MRLLKLDTISSTNDFLKEMAASQPLENFTVVTARNQTKGKGQMGSKWDSESGKNLIMSVFIDNLAISANDIFRINIAFAVSVISALEPFAIPELSIKWPNDIMSGNKKIGGILIENVFRGSGEIVTIAGLGLNVNQHDFSALPKASSLSVVCGKEFDVDLVLRAIIEKAEENFLKWHESTELLSAAYHSALFKMGKPMPFEAHGNKFMGIIQGVDDSGKLQLLLENDTTQFFGIKEIQMLY